MNNLNDMPEFWSKQPRAGVKGQQLIETSIGKW